MSPLWSFAETFLIPAMLLSSIFGMGASLVLRDFTDLGRGRGALWLGLVLQLVWPPVVAVLLVQFFGLAPSWALGLLLVSVVPGGAVSSLFTHLARGNTALSIALTLGSTLLSIVTIPLALRVTAGPHLADAVAVPAGAIAADIALYLLLPLALGMLVYRQAPRLAGRLSKVCVRVSLFLLGTIIVASLASGRIRVLEYGLAPPMILVAFMAILMASSEIIGRLLLGTHRDAVALAMSVGIRNGALALLLTQFFFVGRPEQSHLIYSCLFYAGGSFFAAVPVILRDRALAYFAARSSRVAPDTALPEVIALGAVSGGAKKRS